MNHSRRTVSFLPLILFFLLPFSNANAGDAKSKDVLLTTMQQELQRATTDLGKLTPAPYFLSYEVRDQSYAIAIGGDGVLLTSLRTRRRSADVITHVGTAALDNTHEASRASAIHSGTLATDDDPDAIARELWRLTYQGYRNATKAFLNVQTKTAVNAKEEDTSADFSQEKPEVHLDYKAPIARRIRRSWKSWCADIRRCSEAIRLSTSRWS